MQLGGANGGTEVMAIDRGGSFPDQKVKISQLCSETSEPLISTLAALVSIHKLGIIFHKFTITCGFCFVNHRKL